MSRTRLLTVLGVVAFAVGLGAVFAPGLFALGIERYAVVGIGLLALGGTARFVQGRRHSPRRRGETATPELPQSVTSPGDDIDAVLTAFDRSRQRTSDRRRAQLRSVAETALTRYRGQNEAEVSERIERGTWTNDSVAAAFLAEDPEPASIGSRLRRRLSGTSSYWIGVEHTVAAIAAVAGVDRDGPGSPDPSVLGRFSGLLSRRDAGIGRASAVGDPGPTDRLTGHWRGVAGAALAAIGTGILAQQAGVILVGVVGIGYAAYARSTTAPVATLSLERTVDPPDPDPDETVAVTLTVTNDGDRSLPDVRLVDGVPPSLSVAEGSPRIGTALAPGATATVTYTLTAHRGRHEFGPAQVLVRNLAGSAEREQGIESDEPTRVTCVPALESVGEPVPLRAQPTQYTGRVETSSGGEGIEFFATREYRSGDPMRRIDWNRHARTGELATLEFREERAATVVLVIDRDETAAVGPAPRGETAIQRSIDAASRAYATLVADGNRVGIAGLGDTDCWLAPGSGEVHRARARELLATHPAFRPGSVPEMVLPFGWLATLRSQLPGDAQVVLFSPLTSGSIATIARQLDAYGHPVTVVSPDPTTTDTAASQLATVVRRFRIAELQAAGIPVVDWPWADSLPVALARSARRWSG